MKLLQLFFAFFRIGLFSIGGGYAIIPMIRDQAGADHVRCTDSACNRVFQKRGFEAVLFAACGSRYLYHRAMDQQKMENQSDCIDAAVRSAWRMDLSVALVSAVLCRFKNQGFLGCEIEFSS